MRRHSLPFWRMLRRSGIGEAWMKKAGGSVEDTDLKGGFPGGCSLLDLYCYRIPNYFTSE